MMIIAKASRRALPSNDDEDDDGDGDGDDEDDDDDDDDDGDGGGDGATGECYLQWLIPTATVSFSAATHQHCMHWLPDSQNDKKGHHTTYYMKKSKGCICFEKIRIFWPTSGHPSSQTTIYPN